MYIAKVVLVMRKEEVLYIHVMLVTHGMLILFKLLKTIENY